MGVIIAIFLGAVIGILSYLWYNGRDSVEKLKWIPVAPGLPFFGNILDFSKSTEFLNVLSKFSEKHNGLCQLNMFGKQFILVSDYNVLEFLLTTMKVLNKNDSYDFLHQWLGTGLLTAETEKWKVSRKILTPAFHFSILEQCLDVFETNGNTLVDLLKKETGKSSFDVFPYMAMCALDNICDSAMGVSINAQTNNQSDYVFAVKEMCRITVDRTFSPIKMFDVLYPLTKDYYKEKKYVKTLHSRTISVINARKEELKKEKADFSQDVAEIGAKKKKAFLDLLLQCSVDGKPLSDEDIRQEVDTFMFAGHDTTASAMGFLLYCLAKYPEHQDVVFKEQKTIFGEDKDRLSTYSDLQNMKYLEMVIKETLRLYPPVPFTGRKTHQEVEYKDGKVIPAGISFIIFGFGANRNPEFFPDPEKFDPMRFDVKNPPTYSYIPFSAGPRNCIGQKFAMLEMKAITSKLLRNYKLVSCGHEVILAAETVLKPANGIRIALTPRNWAELE